MSSQPRRSARIASKMTLTQPVVTVSSISLQYRRSPRLAAKRRTIVVEHARHFIIPLFHQLEHTRCLNSRAKLVLQIMNYLTHFSGILVWSPKMRNTISERMEFIWNQIKNDKIINKTLKNDISYCFLTLEQTLLDVQSHPDYVS